MMALVRSYLMRHIHELGFSPKVCRFMKSRGQRLTGSHRTFCILVDLSGVASRTLQMNASSWLGTKLALRLLNFSAAGTPSGAFKLSQASDSLSAGSS